MKYTHRQQFLRAAMADVGRNSQIDRSHSVCLCLPEKLKNKATAANH